MSETIPRGIQVVKWKNSDKSRSVRYRVRISRTDFKCDKLFDDIVEAKAFLADTKSKAGRQTIVDEEEQQIMEAYKANFLNPPLSVYLQKYVDKYIKRKGEEPANETKALSQKAALYRIKSIKQVKVPWRKTMFTKAGLGQISLCLISPEKALGELRLDEITEQTTTEYICARLDAGKAKSTVAREVGLLRTFFNKLRFLDQPAWKVIDKTNPFANADMTLLKNANVKRERRLSEEEESRLFVALAECRNPEMLQITALALATGMRRGEILTLQWKQVEPRAIALHDTKNGKPRRVPLADDARSIIESIPHVDERVFHYTAEGFKSNWQRVRERAGITDFRFHDCRREFISRIIQTITSSSVAVASMTGMKDVRHIERSYIQPLEDQKMIENGIQSQADLMKAVGHGSAQITSRYTTLNNG